MAQPSSPSRNTSLSTRGRSGSPNEGVAMSALGAALIDAQATIEEFTEAVAVLGMLVDCGATPSFGDPDLPLVLNDVLREGEEG